MSSRPVDYLIFELSRVLIIETCSCLQLYGIFCKKNEIVLKTSDQSLCHTCAIPLHLKSFWAISELFVSTFSILDTFICQPAFLGRSRSTPFFCALSRWGFHFYLQRQQRRRRQHHRRNVVLAHTFNELYILPLSS